jgi:NLR family CARD domain-containing protein 3
LYSDGRVDLCKMVTGPRNIGDLMDSLRPNTFSKHFLLGNNIIGPVGAKAIAEFIDEFPDRFETWYLAGNCIDTASFATLVDSMITSSAITNVWLKRNPLGSQAAHDVYRLISQTPNLRTLDLDQTELGDAGVAELFGLLAAHDKVLPLKHIYLNATGVGVRACQQIAAFLKSAASNLHSLYMSNNPIGDAGAAALAEGIKHSDSLARLSVQSCALMGVSALLQAVAANGKMETLDLGQSYATEDLGMHYNWLTVDNVPALIELLS